MADRHPDAQTPPNVFPSFRTRDAATLIPWLLNTFGFREHAVFHDPSGVVTHAEVDCGNGMVMLGDERATREDSLPMPPPGGATVYVVVDDLPAHAARAEAAGAEIVRPLKDEGYGSGYTARDPEGNLWSFGDYTPYAPQ